MFDQSIARPFNARVKERGITSTGNEAFIDRSLYMHVCAANITQLLRA